MMAKNMFKKALGKVAQILSKAAQENEEVAPVQPEAPTQPEAPVEEPQPKEPEVVLPTLEEIIEVNLHNTKLLIQRLETARYTVGQALSKESAEVRQKYDARLAAIQEQLDKAVDITVDLGDYDTLAGSAISILPEIARSEKLDVLDTCLDLMEQALCTDRYSHADNCITAGKSRILIIKYHNDHIVYATRQQQATAKYNELAAVQKELLTSIPDLSKCTPVQAAAIQRNKNLLSQLKTTIDTCAMKASECSGNIDMIEQRISDILITGTESQRELTSEVMEELRKSAFDITQQLIADIRSDNENQALYAATNDEVTNQLDAAIPVLTMDVIQGALEQVGIEAPQTIEQPQATQTQTQADAPAQTIPE